MPAINVKRVIADPWPFVSLWIVGGFLSLIAPVIHWNKKRQSYYDYIGYQIEYENAQRAYEEANKDNQDENYNYQSVDCSWWQWQCRKKVYQYQQQNGDDDQVQVPQWFIFLGGKTEEQRRQAEESGEDQSSSGVLTFVYWWTIILYVLILVYGALVLIKRKDLRVVVFGLFLFAQFALMLMLLMGQGVIETDGRAIENSIYGWNGQMGVLMVYTAFSMYFYSIIAALMLVLRIALQWWQEKKNSKELSDEVEPSSNYKEYEEPTVTLTPA